MDQFLEYLKSVLKERLFISGEYCDILIWGNRAKGNTEIIGLSLNTRIKNINIPEYKVANSVAKVIASRLNVPFLSIVYPDNDIVNTSSVLVINNKKIVASQACNFIQSILGTNEIEIGTSKAINKSISDPFHNWARINLPKNYVRLDIDALYLDSSLEIPLVCIEVKRSAAKKISEWKPYTNDIANYYLELLLCDLAIIEFITVHHANITTKVTSNTSIGFHRILKVDLSRTLITDQFISTTVDKLIEYLKRKYQ